MAIDSAATVVEQQKPRAKRRWFQFSLRSLLILTLLSCCVARWMAIKVQRQKAAVAAIVEAGGSVVYDYQADPAYKEIKDAEPPGPAWLRDLLGSDFFTHVVSARARSDAGMAQFDELGQLKMVNLHCCGSVTDAGLKHLEGLAQLQDLDLYFTKTTDAGLVCLNGSSHLKRLILGGTQITDAGLARVARLTDLRELNLGSTKVTDAGLAHLAGLTQLQNLDLAYTKVTDAGLAHLKGLSRLRLLDLRRTKVTKSGTIQAQLQQALPNYTVLR